jgi:hypothetical protein
MQEESLLKNERPLILFNSHMSVLICAYLLQVSYNLESKINFAATY